MFLARIAGALLLASLICHPPAAVAQPPHQFDATAEQQLIVLINQSRAGYGLPPLAVDDRLTRAARKHTQLSVGQKQLSHQYAEEETLPVRISDENIRSEKQGENIAMDVNAAAAHAALMRSPGHRANILNPGYNAIGVGVIDTGHDLYVTEDFAHRLADYSDRQAEAAVQKTIESYLTSRGMPAPQRRPLPHLHDLACNMALNDALDHQALGLPGVHRSMEWTTGEPEKLPRNDKGPLSQPLPGGYSLGVCFAPSVSYPSGTYWVVMVGY